MITRLNSSPSGRLGGEVFSAKGGLQRAIDTGNMFLWCDEFFSKSYDMKKQKAKELKVYTQKLNI